MLQQLKWVKFVYQYLILNENGAAVESEAVAAADSVRVVAQPKSMVFDKPFLVMVKRKDQPNPYFVMWVDNAELLTKK